MSPDGQDGEAGGEQATLAAGDAVSFRGDVEHSYASAGPEPARFSLTVFEPGVRPRQESRA